MGEKVEIVKKFIKVEEPVKTDKNRRSFKIFYTGDEGSMAEVRNRFAHPTVVFHKLKEYNKDFVGNPFPEVYKLLSEKNFGSATGSMI